MADVTLTDDEHDLLADAVVNYSHAHSTPAPQRFDKYVVPTVERLIAARLAAS